MSLPRIQLAPGGPTFSRMVYGAWRLADNTAQTNVASVLGKIHACLEVGMTTFDHADIYGNHACESLFGDAFAKACVPREKVEFVSKCGIKLVSDKRPEHRIKHYDTGRGHITLSVENSLKALRTDYLDLLLIHRPDPLMDADEIAETFLGLRAAGKVRSFGVSNFTPAQFDLLSSRVPGGMATNQVEFSVLHMDPMNDGTLDQCQRLKVCPMAWSPLAGGRVFQAQGPREERVRAELEAIARELGHATIEQIAYAWLLRHPARVVPVVGTNRLDRIAESARAVGISLSREQWFSIWRASTGRDVP